MNFEQRTHDEARQIIARYPVPRSALLPMLHLVQSEEGFVSADGIAFCAELLDLTKAEVEAVVSFYTMYKREPVGEYLVSVCTNTLCGVLGGNSLYQQLSQDLGVGHEETTADGSITLEHAECLAACDYAPVLTVNYEYYDQMTPESTGSLVESLRAGKAPEPTRGAPVCRFTAVERELAGFIPELPDTGAAAETGAHPGAGEPTLIGARLAERDGISVAGFDPDTPIAAAEKRNDSPFPSPGYSTEVGKGGAAATAASAVGSGEQSSVDTDPEAAVGDQNIRKES